MRTNQQIIFQLREASRLSALPNPHAKRLALIMLDNLVELLLRWKCDAVLGWDKTTWMGLRTHSARVRRGVDRWHASLLRFARDHAWIDEVAVNALTYSHEVRNEAYHDGDVESEDCELSLLLLAYVLRTYLPRHASGKGITMLTGTSVDLDALELDASGSSYVRLTDGSSKPPLGSLPAEYWKKCVDNLLPLPEPARITSLLRTRLDAAIKKATSNLDFIATDGVAVGLYDVVEDRFFHAGMMAPPDRIAPRLSIPGALNLYLALLPREEELLDIADPVERARRLRDVLRAHTPLSEELSQRHLDRTHQRVSDALDRSLPEGLRSFLAAHRELRSILEALGELSSDLDGHIQYLTDVARGK